MDNRRVDWGRREIREERMEREPRGKIRKAAK